MQEVIMRAFVMS